MEKIQYLCDRINNVEWSGILLYSIKGSIRDPKTFELYAEDIIPMDKGTGATTEYQFNDGKGNDRHIDYIDEVSQENPEVLEWKVGCIHSHNNMGVFFSGTDMTDLQENAKAHNFYLSVVVNNRLDIIGKVITYAETEQSFDAYFIAKDENGEGYYLPEKEKVNFKKGITKIYDCEIIREDVQPFFDERFVKYTNEIIKEADRPKYNHFGNYNPGFVEKSKVYNPLTSGNYNTYQDNFDNFLKNQNRNKSFERNLFQQQSEKIITVEDSLIEEFVKFLLNDGNYDMDVSLESMMVFIEDEYCSGMREFNPDEFIMLYPDYYIEFFMGKENDEEHFLTTLKSVIEVFSEIEITYDFIRPLTQILKQFAVNFVKSNRI